MKDVAPYYPRGYMGVCKLGRPVYIERSGMVKPSKIWEIVEEDLFWKAYV